MEPSELLAAKLELNPDVTAYVKSDHLGFVIPYVHQGARDSWCVAVNNHGGYGRWGYVEMTDPTAFKVRLAEAIRLLYDDEPIIGDPDLLDFDAS